MSLKTTAELSTLDIASLGEPFCSIAAKSSVSASGLDVAFQGQPFFAPPTALGPGPGGAQQFSPIIGM